VVQRKTSERARADGLGAEAEGEEMVRALASRKQAKKLVIRLGEGGLEVRGLSFPPCGSYRVRLPCL
jgi:hypothetical protein